MRTLILILILLSVVLLAQLAPLPTLSLYRPRPVTAPQVGLSPLETLYKAAVVIYRRNNSGGYDSVCTGTAFQKSEGGYFFLSASHCFDPKDSYFVSTEELPAVMIPVESTITGDAVAGLDYAVLWVPTKQVFATVPLGADPVNPFGEAVVSVSAPMGLGKQVFRGYISEPVIGRSMVVKDLTGKQTGEWKGGMLIQMPGTNPASSGSAIWCANQNAVCGVLVGVLATPIGQETVALPISRVTEELKAHPPAK